MIRPPPVNRYPRIVLTCQFPSPGPLSSFFSVKSQNPKHPRPSLRTPLVGSTLRSAFLGLTCCGLVACNLGPHYKRPDIPPPQAWRDTPGSEQGWPSSDWWRGFNSPTLNELMDQARVANDDLGAAIARIQQADAQARIAGAPLLPSFGLDADGNRQRARQTILTPAGTLAGGSHNLQHVYHGVDGELRDRFLG